jgi:hypothetical protein
VPHEQPPELAGVTACGGGPRGEAPELDPSLLLEEAELPELFELALVVEPTLELKAPELDGCPLLLPPEELLLPEPLELPLLDDALPLLLPELLLFDVPLLELLPLLLLVPVVAEDEPLLLDEDEDDDELLCTGA